jgi:tripartite-type tricarboxylate transporter receptor subunit TctC
MTNHPRWLAIASLLASVMAAGPLHAQSDYPNKPVRIVVDSAAGSANDATARILGDRLSRIWNQQVLTLNQPGAGGGISARVASQSPNDGYTLYMPATSPFLALPGAPGVSPNLPIELPRDFVPISFVLQQPLTSAPRTIPGSARWRS